MATDLQNTQGDSEEFDEDEIVVSKVEEAWG